MQLNKKFINLIIKLFPQKTTRRRLRAILNGANFNIINSAYSKKIDFLKYKNSINTVAIGSSHCEAGFNSNYIENSFNFGINSADNYMLYEIYTNFLQAKNIKNIVIFYSVFSNGSNNSLSSDFNYSFLPLKFILNIPYKCSFKHNITSLLIAKTAEYKNDFYFGFNEEKNHATGIDVKYLKERCASHYKIWQKGKQNIWIEKLLDKAIEDKKNILIVISPAKEEYKQHIPNRQALFEEITKLIESKKKQYKNINLLNCYNSKDFENNAFWIDMDHLNNNGAEKLTKKINQYLNNKLINISTIRERE